MGIYQIKCSRCGTPFWFSGRADKLCGDCYEKANAEASMLQAGAIDVLEENEPKRIEDEHQKLNGKLRAELEKQVRLRVQTERERDNLVVNQLYKQKVDELREQKANVRAELDAAKAEIERRCVNIDKLESDLRMTNVILDISMRSSERKRQRIAKLEHLLRQLYAVNGLHVPEDL